MGIFDTKITWYSATETCTIVSETETGTAVNAATIYSGPVDFQPVSGTTFTDPAGKVQVVDAIAIIDPLADGSLPAVTLTDNGPSFVLTVNGLRYDVLLAAVWAAPPAHLELHVKRGPQHLQPVT